MLVLPRNQKATCSNDPPLLQVATKQGGPATKQDEGLPEYVLRFHPPIVLHNRLPYPINVTLTDTRSSRAGGVAAQVDTWNIRMGGSQDVYTFDLTKKLKMGIEMQVGLLTAPHPLSFLFPCRVRQHDHLLKSYPVYLISLFSIKEPPQADADETEIAGESAQAVLMS